MNNNLEAILLAGGSGSRLKPFTIYTSKHLLPIDDVPMIFYPLKNLQLIGVTQIYMIVNESHFYQWQALISKYDFGMKIDLVIQDTPGGIPHAMKCCEKLIKGDNFIVALGDNVIIASMFINTFKLEMQNTNNATICGFSVNDPSPFGVATFDEFNNLIKIIEKPKVPPSNIAIGGFYKFPKNVFSHINNLKYSSRGELEISDLINIYIDDNSCDLVASLSHSDYWIDTGNCDAIVKATNFIREMKINSGNDFAKFPLLINNEPSQ
jgi:glucose-1-phosphate thymidylyltransferase